MKKVAKKKKSNLDPTPVPETLEEIESLDNDETYDEKLDEELELPEINEEKHNTFLRLAKPRTQKVVRSLKILGNCANKGSYDYTHLEIVKIFDYIQKALDETKDKFQRKINAEKELFDF